MHEENIDIISNLEFNGDETPLLTHLLRTGITPSFAFPIQVGVFEAVQLVDGKRRVWPKMSTGLSQAFTSYSPGKILTVSGEKYKVGGLVIYDAEDPINRAHSHFSVCINDNPRLSYYNRCIENDCGWVSSEMKNPLDISVCPICNQSDSIQTDIWYLPDGFAPIIVPWQGDNENPGTEWAWNMKPAKIRNQDNEQPAGGVQFPTPVTDADESEIQDHLFSDNSLDRELKGIFERINLRSTRDDGKGVELLLVNSGYNGTGYLICELCGRIERQANQWPSTISPPRTTNPKPGHHRPYAIPESAIRGTNHTHESRKPCLGQPWSESSYERIYLGMTFITDMLMISIPGQSPLGDRTVTTRSRILNNGLRTLKEALISEIQKSAHLVNREISGGVRKRNTTDSEGREVTNFEIYFYDNVSGGAGLSSSIITGENSLFRIIDILKSTENRLSGAECLGAKKEEIDGKMKIEGGCDKSCLGCLLDFRNKREHELFDRKEALRLIRYILYGEIPSINSGSSNYDDTCLEDISNSIKQTLKIMKSDVQIQIDDGCLVGIYGEKKLYIRPWISYIDMFEDPKIKKWEEDGIDFDDVEADSIFLDWAESNHYICIEWDKLRKNPSDFSESLDTVIRGLI